MATQEWCASAAVGERFAADALAGQFRPKEAAW
jgi:hypothetical protein